MLSSDTKYMHGIILSVTEALHKKSPFVSPLMATMVGTNQSSPIAVASKER